MPNLTVSTKPVKAEQVKREWHLIDVKGKVLGRVAGEIARLLQGKHKVEYVPYLDVGDYVVVINAAKIKVTGRKKEQKEYQRYSGYPGGLKRTSLGEMLKRKPEYVIEKAVSGMLPKNKHRKKRLRRLFVFAGQEHNFGDKFGKEAKDAKKN